MTTIYICLAVFILLLVAPIVMAVSYYKIQKGEILHISQNRVRDERYFGKSFSSMVESKLSGISGDIISLSRDETFFDNDNQKYQEEKIDKLVLCREMDFDPPIDVLEFHKEIYCARKAYIKHEGVIIRAIYSKDDMLLHNGITIERWADTDKKLTVYDNCKLGISATAGEKMCIGYNCEFNRMYAPEICIAQHPEDNLDPFEGVDPRIFRLPVQMEKENNVRYINKEKISEDGTFDHTVIASRNVKVIEDIIVTGDIRSAKGVRLCDNSVVCGNIFAEDDIILGKNAIVLGNIFTQGSVIFEEGAIAGQRGRISSVIAREHITFNGKNFVFGYVSCERGGRTKKLNSEATDKTPVFIQIKDSKFIDCLYFNDLDDFNNVDQQGFRNDGHIQEALIPVGALSVQNSMFFNCSELTRVYIPKSINDIGTFAFADSRKLTELVGIENTSIENIGCSAFENCQGLKDITLPGTLRKLGGAAFAGCKNLERITFPFETSIEFIGDHCCNGCKKLRKIWIPDTVQYVGISAFKDCPNLTKVSAPETLKSQPGLMQLENNGVKVIYRVVQTEDLDESAG